MIGLQKSQPDKIFCQEVAEDFHLLTSQQQMKKFFLSALCVSAVTQNSTISGYRCPSADLRPKYGLAWLRAARPW